MALLDEGDDLLSLAGFGEGSKEADDASLKALQAAIKRKQQRAASQAAASSKVAQAEADVAGMLESLEEADAEGSVLQQQQAKLQEMHARVVQELDKGDSEAAGPEPGVHADALFPVQALPELQLEALPELAAALQQQRQVLGLTPDTTTATSSSSSSSSGLEQLQLSDTFEWLLSEGAAARWGVCPSEGVARAAFRALCYGHASLALAAYTRLLAWCGEPEVVAGSELMGLSQLQQWCGGTLPSWPAAAASNSNSSSSNGLALGTTLADSMPPVTVQWLPAAADVLEALAALGFKHHHQQQQQQQKQQGGEEEEGADRAGQQQQGAAAGSSAAFKHANLPLLLRLLGRVARGCAAGRLEARGLVSSPGQYQQLLLALLSLMLDPRAALMCRCCLPEALSALLELPPDSMWDRLVRDTAPGSLLHALSGGLGPSHRSAVLLLSQLPRSTRGTVLRQLGGLQLMAKLIPKAKQQVPPARVSGQEPRQLRTSLHNEVRTLLGPTHKVRVLLTRLSDPPQPGQVTGRPQVWELSSVLEAADAVLWVDVSTPGVGISPELRRWLLDWLSAFDRVLDKRLDTHRVRHKVAAMDNAYRFADWGCVVARGG